MKKREYLSYGVASIADSAPYGFVSVYLILFLTTVAGLSPAKAGMIFSGTILINGLAESIIGYISDNTQSKFGRRRPYLLIALPFISLGLPLAFFTYPVGEGAKVVLYFCATLIFWSGYGIYYTPYTALGAEISRDYDQRSTLRSYARIFGILGNIISMVLPLTIVQKLGERGIKEETGWFLVAVGITIIACVSIFWTWKAMAGKEEVFIGEKEKRKLPLLKIIKEYWSIMKLHPFKYLVMVVLLFMIANTLYNSTMVFYTRNILGIKDNVAATIFMISMIAN
ncbi:MAG: MFS transporter, partial [Anaerovoracaceae bacterium]